LIKNQYEVVDVLTATVQVMKNVSSVVFLK